MDLINPFDSFGQFAKATVPDNDKSAPLPDMGLPTQFHLDSKKQTPTTPINNGLKMPTLSPIMERVNTKCMDGNRHGTSGGSGIETNVMTRSDIQQNQWSRLPPQYSTMQQNHHSNKSVQQSQYETSNVLIPSDKLSDMYAQYGNPFDQDQSQKQHGKSQLEPPPQHPQEVYHQQQLQHPPSPPSNHIAIYNPFDSVPSPSSTVVNAQSNPYAQWDRAPVLQQQHGHSQLEPSPQHPQEVCYQQQLQHQPPVTTDKPLASMPSPSSTGVNTAASDNPADSVFAFVKALPPPRANIAQTANNISPAPDNADDDDIFGLFSANPKPSQIAENKLETLVTKMTLPPGGEVYEEVFDSMVGVIFTGAHKVKNSLFLEYDEKTADALDARPVVGLVSNEHIEAQDSRIQIGHVLLKVNGVETRNANEAAKLINDSPRPIEMSFYIPDIKVTLSEGLFMVKYNDNARLAPTSSKAWKQKYVVVEGIISKGCKISMYRSKAEYIVAAMATFANRPVSVKVKQFSIPSNSKIMQDKYNPVQTKKYKNEREPWKYITVIRKNNMLPIKISSTNANELNLVHEGIRRLLKTTQKGP